MDLLLLSLLAISLICVLEAFIPVYLSNSFEKIGIGKLIIL